MSTAPVVLVSTQSPLVGHGSESIKILGVPGGLVRVGQERLRSSLYLYSRRAPPF